MDESRRLSPRQLGSPRLSSGLPRGRRVLSGASHTDAQVRATQLAERRLQSASLVRRLDSPPTASSNERVAPRTASPQAKATKKKKKQKTTSHSEEDRGEEDHQKNTSRPRPTTLALCVPLYSLSLIAPPSFQLLREASRKEALPISNASPL